MAETKPAYRKLRGTGSSGLAQTRRMWLGEDHLLAVSTAYGFERYRRFYFVDIRAVVIRLTAVRLGWNIFFAVASLLALGGAVACLPSGRFSWGDSGEMVGFWIFCGIGSLLLLGLGLNSAFGPSCEMYLQTLAGLEALGAPKRLRRARRLQAQIAPLIEAAQAFAIAPPPLPAAASLNAP